MMKAFICGMSRGGTTWLGHCLNQHPEVAVFGESLYWGRNYIEPAHNGKYTIEQINQVLGLLKRDCKAFLGDGEGNLKCVDRDSWIEMLQSIHRESMTPSRLFELVCRRIAERESAKYVVEKTPHHVNWIPRIVGAFPEAKFVIMVRDPYSFMLSYKHQGDRKSESSRENLRSLYHPLGCAYMWRKYMKSAMQNSRRFPDQTLIINFEVLKRSPEACWSQLLSFYGMPEARFMPVGEKNSSFRGVERKLESIDIFWMNVIARSYIRAGGYALQPSGASFREVVISMWGLCPWFMRSLKLLKSRVPGGLSKYFLKSGK